MRRRQRQSMKEGDRQTETGRGETERDKETETETYIQTSKQTDRERGREEVKKKSLKNSVKDENNFKEECVLLTFKLRATKKRKRRRRKMNRYQNDSNIVKRKRSGSKVDFSFMKVFVEKTRCPDRVGILPRALPHECCGKKGLCPS